MRSCEETPAGLFFTKCTSAGPPLPPHHSLLSSDPVGAVRRAASCDGRAAALLPPPSLTAQCHISLEVPSRRALGLGLGAAPPSSSNAASLPPPLQRRPLPPRRCVPPCSTASPVPQRLTPPPALHRRLPPAWRRHFQQHPFLHIFLAGIDCWIGYNGLCIMQTVSSEHLPLQILYLQTSFHGSSPLHRKPPLPFLIIQSRSRFALCCRRYLWKPVYQFLFLSLLIGSSASAREDRRRESTIIVEGNNDGDVKIVVGKNLDQIVLDASKDVLLEIYAPWCGHCQALEPTYNKLAKHLHGIDSFVIAKLELSLDFLKLI